MNCNQTNRNNEINTGRHISTIMQITENNRIHTADTTNSNNRIRDCSIPAHIDNGSSVSIISKSMAEKLTLSIFKLKKGIIIRTIDESKSY